MPDVQQSRLLCKQLENSGIFVVAAGVFCFPGQMFLQSRCHNQPLAVWLPAQTPAVRQTGYNINMHLWSFLSPGLFYAVNEKPVLLGFTSAVAPTTFFLFYLATNICKFNRSRGIII